MSINNFGRLFIGASIAGVLLLPVAATAQVTFYGNQGAFNAVASSGRTMTAFENFEASTLPPGSVFFADDPLNASTNNAYYTSGSIVAGLNVQSNTGGTNSSALAPGGVQALGYGSIGFLGHTSDVVVSHIFVNALDLSFTIGGLTAVGFNVVDVFGTNLVKLNVYDTSNVLIGSLASTPGNAGGTNFVGMTSVADIGRINIFSLGNGAEGADNIEMWTTAVPEPVTIAVLGFGAALVARRRRRK